MFAEAQPPSAKSPVVVFGTPGTSLFAQLDSYPVVALHVMNEQLYVITTSEIYQVGNDYTPVKVGDIELGERVSVADNGIQLVIVDGERGWYWTEADGVTEITADGFYPANTVTFQDSYFIFNRSGTGQFFISELLSVDFDPLKFATAEGAPDETVAVESNHRELWVFGTRSTEIWYNSGNVDFTFDRIQGAFIERGCLAPHSIAKVNGQMVWLADDGMVYAAVGYQPQRISNEAMESKIARATNKTDAFSWTYSEQGHTFYCLTFPTDKMTLCFDFNSGLWHERSHIHHGRHVANCCASWKGMNIVGDFSSPFIFQMSLDSYADFVYPIQRVMQSAQVHASRERITAHSLELDMESGIGLPSGKESDPQAMLQWSDDGGKTWSNEHWAPIGKMGEYLTRVKWNRLGRFRQRTWRVVFTEKLPIVVMAAWMEV